LRILFYIREAKRLLLEDVTWAMRTSDSPTQEMGQPLRFRLYRKEPLRFRLYRKEPLRFRLYRKENKE